MFEQNLHDVTNFHDKLIERMNLVRSLKIPKVPVRKNSPDERTIMVQGLPVTVGVEEQKIDR